MTKEEYIAVLNDLDTFKDNISFICCIASLIQERPITQGDKDLIYAYATGYCFKCAKKGLDLCEQLSVMNSPITNNVLPFIVSKDFNLFDYKFSKN